MHHASWIMHCRKETEIWYVDCSHKCKINQGVMVGWKGTSAEDNLCWKTTFVEGRPLLEDDLCWKTTFVGRRPSVEDDLQWKTTIDGRWSSVDDKLWWKRTFGERRPSLEDDLQWKTTFSGRWPLLDPCLLPTPLCGIFQISLKFRIVWNIR